VGNNYTTDSTYIDIDSGARYRADLHALPPLLLRVGDVAELLSISRSTAYRLIRSGELPSVKVGCIIRVPFDQLCDWVAEHTVMGEAA
jgi:excisionase family DNA binding protein